MGKNTKRMTRTTDRPARRASRSTTPAAPVAQSSQTPAVTAQPSPAPVVEVAAEVEPAAPAASAEVLAPTHGQVAQLAFRYFAEAGYVHGHALDHWLRAESELARA